jgi:hypothetical protein
MIFKSIILSLLFSASCFASDNENNGHPKGPMHRHMTHFQGVMPLVRFHDMTPTVMNRPETPRSVLSTERYREILNAIKIQNINEAYRVLCQNLEKHPQKENLRALAYCSFKDRAQKEFDWINQKIMTFDILKNFAVDIHQSEQKHYFEQSFNYWNTIKNGLATWVEASRFNKNDSTLYHDLFSLASEYQENLDCAELMMDDALLKKGNPYAVPSLSNVLTTEAIQEIRQHLEETH